MNQDVIDLVEISQWRGTSAGRESREYAFNLLCAMANSGDEDARTALAQLSKAAGERRRAQQEPRTAIASAFKQHQRRTTNEQRT